MRNYFKHKSVKVKGKINNTNQRSLEYKAKSWIVETEDQNIK